MNNAELSWCGGFFDGEGSFSFCSGCPYISVVNTNPIAVAYFFEIMKKNNIDFKISERSKPSKSSKKKRWDMYMMDRTNVFNFLSTMEDYVHGKKKQLFLMKNFYDESDQKKRKYSDIVKDYQQVMMYYNQTSNLILINEEKLFEKLGFQLDFNHHEIINESNISVSFDSFNDINYLAGIIDAEGTVYINKRNMNNSYDRFIPSISVVNTNKEIVKRCFSTLKNNGVGCHIQSRVNESRNRVRWDISVSGVKRVSLLSEMLKNRMVIKNRQVDIIHKYCSFRLNDLLSKNDLANSFKESIEALNKEN